MRKRRFYVSPRKLDNLEADAEGLFVLVPIGAEHFEAADLRRRTDMTANAGTDIIVADAHQADGLAGIVRQSVKRHALRQIVLRDKLEGHRQVLVNQALHLTLYLTFLLTTRFVVEAERHLALLALNVGIEGTLAAEQPNHGLVQEVLGGVRGGKLLLVVFVENNIVHR